MYYADNGVYPGNGHYSSTFVTGSTMCGALSAGAHWSVVLTGTFSTFLPTLPVDPSSGCYIYSRVGTSGVNCNLPGGGVVNLASREYVLGFKAEQNLTSQYPYFGTGSDAVYCIFGPIK